MKVKVVAALLITVSVAAAAFADNKIPKHARHYRAQCEAVEPVMVVEFGRKTAFHSRFSLFEEKTTPEGRYLTFVGLEGELQCRLQQVEDACEITCRASWPPTWVNRTDRFFRPVDKQFDRRMMVDGPFLMKASQPPTTPMTSPNE